ncbi:MAG: TadE/TadG family type IV pilus assembly protein [Pirellulales bacterium]
MGRRRLSTAKPAGVAAVEAALVLPLCLVGLIALLDLALAVAQFNSLAECARRGARTAIVRGDQSTVIAPVGHSTWSGTADQPHPLTDAFRSLLVCMPPGDVDVTAEWPDGGNRAGQRVRVILTFEHTSLVTTLFGNGDWQLTSSSTMRIVH